MGVMIVLDTTKYSICLTVFHAYRITEQNRTEILFVKTCTYIHHHTKHLIQLYTRDIQ